MVEINMGKCWSVLAALPGFMFFGFVSPGGLSHAAPPSASKPAVKFLPPVKPALRKDATSSHGKPARAARRGLGSRAGARNGPVAPARRDKIANKNEDALRLQKQRREAFERQRRINAEQQSSVEAWDKVLSTSKEENNRRQKALEEFVRQGGTVADFELQERNARNPRPAVPRGEIDAVVAPAKPLTVQQIRDSYSAAYELAKTEIARPFTKTATVSFPPLDAIRVKTKGEHLEIYSYITTIVSNVIARRPWTGVLHTFGSDHGWKLIEAHLGADFTQGQPVPKPDPE